MSPHHVQLFINGQKRLSSSGETFETYNPGTKQHTGHVESASSADVQEAIQAASAAFPAWERVFPSERRKILNKAADLLESEKYVKRLIESVAQEVGYMAGPGEAHAAATQLREGKATF
jgi:acyl-CoA reductase-like NAD-dependent aldehyde dehydrogenase